jgi:hypothetical protein
MNMKVLHFDRDHVNGEEVPATYEWNYNEEDVEITPPKCTDGKATVKRLSPEDTEFALTTDWSYGYEQLWFSFGKIDYDLENYEISTIGGGIAVIPEGKTMSKEDLKPVVKSYETGAVLPEDCYDLTVKKALGWSSEDLDYVYSTDPKDNQFPLKVWDKDHYDINDVADGGTAVYLLTAKGKGDYSGETDLVIVLYSDHTLNYYATWIDYPANPHFLDEPPYIQYEVEQGKTMEPTAVSIGNYSDPIKLTKNDYEIKYVDFYTGEETATFPTEIGLYKVVVTGIGDYYGSNESDEIDFIKIGKKNPMSVKAKKLTAKSNKKTTFSAKKAFTVKKAKGAVSYEKISGNSKITVSKNGKVTVKKGLKKGKTYSVKVEVTNEGTATYLSASKIVTLKVKVK